MRLLATSLLVISLASAGTALAQESPTWAELSAAEAPSAFKVVQYLDVAQESSLIVVAAGKHTTLRPGSLLKTFRGSVQAVQGDARSGVLWVETGRLRIIDVQDELAIAEVQVQGSALSKAVFPKFPGVMGGDLAVGQRVTLARRQSIVPTVTLSYFDLFEDPKGMPTSFELKAPGLERLKAAAAAFAGARLSLLMVEGYTDHNGAESANQIESYQRALTVRQYLIDELGFDEKRVVAVGFGATEPADGTFAPGYVEANRRIVLKAVQVPGP